jgi:hypothetical protein
MRRYPRKALIGDLSLVLGTLAISSFPLVKGHISSSEFALLSVSGVLLGSVGGTLFKQKRGFSDWIVIGAMVGPLLIVARIMAEWAIVTYAFAYLAGLVMGKMVVEGNLWRSAGSRR